MFCYRKGSHKAIVNWTRKVLEERNWWREANHARLCIKDQNTDCSELSAEDPLLSTSMVTLLTAPHWLGRERDTQLYPKEWFITADNTNSFKIPCKHSLSYNNLNFKKKSSDYLKTKPVWKAIILSYGLMNIRNNPQFYKCTVMTRSKHNKWINNSFKLSPTCWRKT